MAHRNPLKNAIRNSHTIPKEKCFVCNGTTRNQEHHIIKVITLYNICMNNHFDKPKQLYVPEVPLCDYHHKLEHTLCGDTDMFCEITEQEIDRLEDILTEVTDLIGSVPVGLELDYWEAYDNLCSTFETLEQKHLNRTLTRECEIKHYFDNEKPIPKELQFTEADFIRGDENCVKSLA